MITERLTVKDYAKHYDLKVVQRSQESSPELCLQTHPSWARSQELHRRAARLAPPLDYEEIVLPLRIGEVSAGGLIIDASNTNDRLSLWFGGIKKPLVVLMGWPSNPRAARAFGAGFTPHLGEWLLGDARWTAWPNRYRSIYIGDLPKWVLTRYEEALTQFDADHLVVVSRDKRLFSVSEIAVPRLSPLLIALDGDRNPRTYLVAAWGLEHELPQSLGGLLPD